MSTPPLRAAGAAILLVAAGPAAAGVSVTAPSGVVVHGLHPDSPLYERLLLEDLVSFELDFENRTGGALRFQSATAEYFDALGRSLGTAAIDGPSFLDHLQVVEGPRPFG